MKQLLTFALLLLTMTAGAQTWEKKTESADIIKETPERTYYELRMDSITTVKVYADNCEWYLTSLMPNNAFKLTLKAFQMQVSEMQSRATFGFLDTDGNIAQPTIKNIKVTATYHGRIIGSGKWTEQAANKVAVYLLTCEGSVQVVAPLHMGGEYNAKIPCIPKSIQ